MDAHRCALVVTDSVTLAVIELNRFDPVFSITFTIIVKSGRFAIEK